MKDFTKFDLVSMMDGTLEFLEDMKSLTSHTLLHTLARKGMVLSMMMVALVLVATLKILEILVCRWISNTPYLSNEYLK